MHAADRALTRPRPRAAAALVAVVALIAAGVAALWSVQPPQARGADVPPGEFSAARAFEQVQTIAAEPHVAGSAANDRVREHLISTLRGLGLSPEVQDTVSVQGGELSSSAGGIGLARVRNVVAVIPGTAPDRPGLPGRALRLGAERPGRQRRRRGHRHHPGDGPGADHRAGGCATTWCWC